MVLNPRFQTSKNALNILMLLFKFFINNCYKGSNEMSIINQHGGDLDAIERTYKIPREEIIDFSGNINPLGVPESIKNTIRENADMICTYPDVSYKKLRESIEDYTGVKSEYIVVGNGSTELISLFIKTLLPKKSIIISPAYSEYERELKLVGSEIELFPLQEDDDFKLNIEKLKNKLNNDIDLLVLCNPNNPTGSYLTACEIDSLLSFCVEKNIYIMIDETYVEFSDSDKNVEAMPLIKKYKNLFIIRGTSKFFASPGLRLGYCICSDKDLLNSVSEKKDPWSVNILANLAGIVMFKDTEFIKKSKKLIVSERNKIIKELSELNKIKIYDTQSNFILIKILDKNITSAKVFDSLIKDKIVIRDASDFPYLGNHFLRFCILSPENNDLLISKLKSIF